MDKEKLKRISARIDRQAGITPLPLYIRIGKSTLYDYNRGVRATLKEIAYMAVNGDGSFAHPSDERKNVDYEGWCWARQAYLAERVGCSERQVNSDIAQFVRDGVIETRGWTDKYGHRHTEYKVVAAVVDASQRVEGQERRRPTSRVYAANKGSFSNENQPAKHATPTPISRVHHDANKSNGINKGPDLSREQGLGEQQKPHEVSAVAHKKSQPSPYETSAVTHKKSQPSATAETAVKGVEFVRSSVRVSGGGVSTTPLRGAASTPSLAREERDNGKSNTNTKSKTGSAQGFDLASIVAPLGEEHALVSRATAKAEATPNATPAPKRFACDECLGEDGVHHRDCSYRPRRMSQAEKFALAAEER
jgi:hypothetical protein